MWFPAPISLFPIPMNMMSCLIYVFIFLIFFLEKDFLNYNSGLIPLFYFLSLISIVCFYIFSHNLNFVWILGELLKLTLLTTDFFSAVSIMFFNASNVLLYSFIYLLIFLKPFLSDCITFNLILLTFLLNYLSLTDVLFLPHGG